MPSPKKKEFSIREQVTARLMAMIKIERQLNKDRLEMKMEPLNLPELDIVRKNKPVWEKLNKLVDKMEEKLGL